MGKKEEDRREKKILHKNVNDFPKSPQTFRYLLFTVFWLVGGTRLEGGGKEGDDLREKEFSTGPLKRMGINGVTVLRDRCKSKLFLSFLFCFRCLMPFNLRLFFLLS